MIGHPEKHNVTEESFWLGKKKKCTRVECKVLQLSLVIVFILYYGV